MLIHKSIDNLRVLRACVFNWVIGIAPPLKLSCFFNKEPILIVLGKYKSYSLLQVHGRLQIGCCNRA